MNKQREKVELLVYGYFDKLDKTGQNTTYYKKLFGSFTDEQFKKFMSRKLPLRFNHKLIEVEPTMPEIISSLDFIGVPLLEKISLPYLYTDKNGNPVKSHECYVIYTHLKKMKQFVTKKNAMSTDISERDMKTGLLLNYDKNGKTSDREMESLLVSGLMYSAKEFSGVKADALRGKNIMYNTISTQGQVSQADIPDDYTDSLARNLLDVYLLGSLLKSNLITDDYYLKHTLNNRQRKVQREV